MQKGQSNKEHNAITTRFNADMTKAKGILMNNGYAFRDFPTDSFFKRPGTLVYVSTTFGVALFRFTIGYHFKFNGVNFFLNERIITEDSFWDQFLAASRE